MSDKVKKKIVKAAEKAPEPVEDDGLAALSALVRPSTVPPVAGSEASDVDDGKLDLRALAASLPSPEPMAPVAHDAHASDDDDDEDEEEEVTPPPKKAKKKKAATAAAEPAPRRAEVAEPAQSGGGGMWIGLAIVAVLGLGGAYYWYAFMNQGDDASASDALASSAPTSVSGVEEPAPDEEPSVEAVEPSVEEPAPAVAEAGEPVAVAEAAAEPEGNDRRRDRDRNRSRTQEAAPAQAAPAQTARAEAPAAPTPAAPQQGRNIDNMLDDALGGRPNAEGTGTEARPAERPAAPPPQAANGNLPNEPPRGDVLRILGRLMPQIRQCAGDQVGMANAVIVMRGDGSVATVSVGGSPFGGSPQGACMEGALRGARFPQFSQATYRVSYPFNIR